MSSLVQNTNPGGVRERPEELGLEAVEIVREGGRRCAGGPYSFEYYNISAQAPRSIGPSGQPRAKACGGNMRPDPNRRLDDIYNNILIFIMRIAVGQNATCEQAARRNPAFRLEESATEWRSLWPSLRPWQLHVVLSGRAAFVETLHSGRRVAGTRV
jgi:hypothetical protein